MHRSVSARLDLDRVLVTRVNERARIHRHLQRRRCVRRYAGIWSSKKISMLDSICKIIYGSDRCNRFDWTRCSLFRHRFVLRQNAKIQEWPNTTNPACQNVKMSKYHDAKMPNCQNAIMPSGPHRGVLRCHDKFPANVVLDASSVQHFGTRHQCATPHGLRSRIAALQCRTCVKNVAANKPE